MSRSSWSVLKTLLPYVWNNGWRLRLRLVTAVVLVFCGIALNIITPLLFGYAVKSMSSQHVSVLVPMIIGGYGIFWTIGAVIVQVKDAIIFRVLERAVRRLSLDLFDHLHTLSLKFHLSIKTGAVLSAINRAQNALPELFWAMGLYVIPTVIELFSAGIVFGRLYGWTYAAMLVSASLAYCVYILLAVEKSTTYQRTFNDVHNKTSAWIVESLSNFETVKYFSSHRYEHALCDKLLENRERAASRRWIFSFVGVYGGGGLVMGISLFLFTLFLAYKVVWGDLDIGGFVAIHTYFTQSLDSLANNFPYMVRKIREGFVDMEYVFDLMSISPEVIDRPMALPVVKKSPTIEFRNVSFAYEEQRKVLHDISFELPAGQTLAIVGSTGSGKSTIARLLFRFYDVSSGAVFIDGEDVRNIKQDSLRASIGILPQDVTLFDMSIYDNIVYGHQDATEQDVENAVRFAHLKDFITSLPDGYQTMVGTRGLALSGGEKQRIALARVFLKKPQIYIFDEPTSALDAYTQREISHNLRVLSEDLTTLIIAHRLTTVAHADRIIVLDKGKILEQGSHSQLLSQDGYYAFLWKQQQSEA